MTECHAEFADHAIEVDAELVGELQHLLLGTGTPEVGGFSSLDAELLGYSMTGVLQTVSHSGAVSPTTAAAAAGACQR